MGAIVEAIRIRLWLWKHDICPKHLTQRVPILTPGTIHFICCDCKMEIRIAFETQLAALRLRRN